MMTDRVRTLATVATTSPTSLAAAAAAAVRDQADEGGFEVDFLPAEHLIRQMRRITRTQLCHWDLTTLSDDATLAVSELVTNAIKHGKGQPVGLRVRRSPYELRIEVTDGTPSPARLRSADVADENGRGLFLVAALAWKWGVSKDGRTTWCMFQIPEGRA